jgi:hypothetical protein
MPETDTRTMLPGHRVHAIEFVMALLGSLVVPGYMWFKALVEIVRAPACHDDCDKEKEDCDDGKDGQGSGCWRIVCFPSRWRSVDSNEFEYEVG